jgi:ribosome-binding protein aMBF1 (putative translation factor)
MKLSDKNFTKEDIALADFAKAIALPIRVRIIRLIIENGNEVPREKLHEAPFNPTVINLHLLDLVHLKIVKSKRKGKGRGSLFSVNEDIFVKMSNNFLNLFESASKLGEEANEVVSRPRLKKKRTKKEQAPKQRFGRYIKEKRRALGFSQEDFAAGLDMDRAHLSRIECSKKTLKPEKLNKLAEMLQIPFEELKAFYYKDQMIELAIESQQVQ